MPEPDLELELSQESELAGVLATEVDRLRILAAEAEFAVQLLARCLRVQGPTTLRKLAYQACALSLDLDAALARIQTLQDMLREAGCSDDDSP